MLSATQVWGNFVNERTNLSVLPFSFSHIGVIFPCWKQSFFCEVRKLISIEWRSIICFQHNGYTESGKHLFKFRQYWLRLYWINYFNLRKATIIVNNNYDVFSWQVRPSKICRQLVPWHGRFGSTGTVIFKRSLCLSCAVLKVILYHLVDSWKPNIFLSAV